MRLILGIVPALNLTIHTRPLVSVAFASSGSRFSFFLASFYLTLGRGSDGYRVSFDVYILESSSCSNFRLYMQFQININVFPSFSSFPLKSSFIY